jgi:hypothetical protein
MVNREAATRMETYVPGFMICEARQASHGSLRKLMERKQDGVAKAGRV